MLNLFYETWSNIWNFHNGLEHIPAEDKPFFLLLTIQDVSNLAYSKHLQILGAN